MDKICKCGHDRKYHSEGMLDKDIHYCELPGCYYPGENSQTCPCTKFKLRKVGVKGK